LQERGKLSLDDKVSKYFPSLTRAGEVSIRQLLSHTAGYEDYAPQDYILPAWKQPTTPRTILDKWAQMATVAFMPDEPASSDKATGEVKAILESLRGGKIDRSLFTSNANSCFTAESLGDIRKSLGGLGKLKSLTRTSETLRGGMTHRNYRAEYAKKTLSLNIYVMPDGKYKQFMVEE
jgi:hypothetical protein